MKGEENDSKRNILHIYLQIPLQDGKVLSQDKKQVCFSLSS